MPLPPPPTPSPRDGLAALQAILAHRSALPALQALHARLGNVFQMDFPGFKPVVMSGPEANRFVLAEGRHDLRWRTWPDPVVRLLRRGLLVQDGADHKRLRTGLMPAFHRLHVQDYAPAMLRRTDQVSAAWDLSRPLDMLVEMRRITLLVLVETLFGADFTPDMPRLWPAILRLLEYISPGLWLVWPSAPRPGFARAIRQVDAYLYALIAARRTSSPAQDDLLSLLVHHSAWDDDLIRDQMLTLLIAGHDTSTALLAWALHLLGEHPQVRQQAQAEVRRVLGDEPPGPQHFPDLPYLGQVIDETLRLYPPVHTGNRLAAQDLEFGGYRIPAGQRVIYSIYLTHHDPASWPDPERFDPERFGQGRFGRGLRVKPYTYLPFGGGPRNCIGAAFAQVEAKIVLARLLQRFDLQAVEGRPVHLHMGATLEPRPGVWLKAGPAGGSNRFE